MKENSRSNRFEEFDSFEEIESYFDDNCSENSFSSNNDQYMDFESDIDKSFDKQYFMQETTNVD